MFIGTDIGVFTLDLNGNRWVLFNNGLPNVVISELGINYKENKLYTATFGRGLWETNIPNCNYSPAIIRNGDTILCKGDSLRLSIPGGYQSYKWSNGSSSESIIVKDSGYYFCITTGFDGCRKTSDTLLVVIAPRNEINITSKGSITFCEGYSVLLEATPGFAGYKWSTGDTSRVLIVKTSEILSVTGYSDKGCKSKSGNVQI